MEQCVDWPKINDIVEEFRRGCSTPLTRLQMLVDDFRSQMEAGLARDGVVSLGMLLTFVRNLPSGNESGVYYALDVGGTNLRVLRLELGGMEKRIVTVEHEEMSLPSEIMTGSNDDLFDFIADALERFVSKEGPHFAEEKKDLGFTFSFPMCLKSIHSGILLHWTKGFSINETIGKDVTHELHAAMLRRNLNMRVVALVNDTVATLAGGRYWDKDVTMGVIVGTGSNACYVERTENIPKWPSEITKPDYMVVDLEWGSFSSAHLPKTSVDHDMDQDWSPGEHTFEKLFSGMYLGDIVRRLLLKLAQEGCLFGGSVPRNMTKIFSLKTPQISSMHEDKSSELENVGKVFNEVFECKPCDIPLEVRKLVVHICDVVTARGARLVAAGIVGILKKIGMAEANRKMPRLVVAVDGSLYEHYPKFRTYLHTCLVELLGEEVAQNVVLKLFKDASGIGAALLAASHSKT